jgi:6-phospho-beta-glucosidase
VDGVDRLPDLIAREADSIGEHIGIPPSLIRLLGAIPSYYLRYFYLTDEVLREQLSGAKRSRAEEVMAIEEGLLEMYRDPNLTEKPKLLEKRGGAFYSEAAAQLIASLYDSTGDDQVVDIRNDGAIPDLPGDAVVEIPARIDRDGAHPGRFAPLPPEMLGLVQQVKAYERLTVKAAIDGDRDAALKALIANPLVGRYSVATGLLEALLQANRKHLPRFFPQG